MVCPRKTFEKCIVYTFVYANKKIFKNLIQKIKNKKRMEKRGYEAVNCLTKRLQTLKMYVE